MILVKSAIIEAFKNGEIVIDPFRPEQLGTNSYDVRLGQHFAFVDYSMFQPGEAYDQHDEEQMKRVWRIQQAGPKGFQLRAGETVLAHTDEFIGGAGTHGYVITSNFHTRSGSKRNLFDCNGGAGYGDVGYIGRWTLEITNHHSVPLLLRPGARVGQIEFILATGETHLYGESSFSGKYGKGRDEWTPEDMLPKSYKDWDVDKVKLGSIIELSRNGAHESR